MYSKSDQRKVTAAIARGELRKLVMARNGGPFVQYLIRDIPNCIYLYASQRAVRMDLILEATNQCAEAILVCRFGKLMRIGERGLDGAFVAGDLCHANAYGIWDHGKSVAECGLVVPSVLVGGEPRQAMPCVACSNVILGATNRVPLELGAQPIYRRAVNLDGSSYLIRVSYRRSPSYVDDVADFAEKLYWTLIGRKYRDSSNVLQGEVWSSSSGLSR